MKIKHTELKKISRLKLQNEACRSLLIVSNKVVYAIWICPVFYIIMQCTESWSTILVPSAPAALWPAPVCVPGTRALFPPFSQWSFSSFPIYLVHSLLVYPVLILIFLAHLLVFLMNWLLHSSLSGSEWGVFLLLFWVFSSFLDSFQSLFPLLGSSNVSLFLHSLLGLSFCLVSPSTFMWCSLDASIILTDSFPFPNSSSHLNLF